MNGADASFRDIPNGVPGLAARLPLMWHFGVNGGHLTPSQFVSLTAQRPAEISASPRKGRISPGADADIVLWDPAKRVTLTNAMMQQTIDYTPYEAMEVAGWPVATIRRGEVVMRDGRVQAAPGRGGSWQDRLTT